MHDILVQIKSQLDALVTQLMASIPNDDPFGPVHGNWSFPSVSRSELVEEAQELISLIDETDDSVKNLGDHEARLSDYPRRILFLRQNTVPNIWGNANAGVSAYVLTISALRKELKQLKKTDTTVLSKRARQAATQISGLEARLSSLQPRANALTAMVERIENAYESADRLPADLKLLEEARDQIAILTDKAKADRVRSEDILKKIGFDADAIKEYRTEADAILKHCHTAYAASTSVGLAVAFSERSSVLDRSMLWWVGGLIVALATGGVFGSIRVREFIELFANSNSSTTQLAVNTVLVILSVGGPVWFAWLSTKQIGHRFRLAEDYAFKAAVSRAYEGYRRETERTDPSMQKRLLASALTRLEEPPLRLVETATPGSPLHEFASSDVIKEAVRTIPSFVASAEALARGALNSVGDAAKSVASAASGKKQKSDSDAAEK